MRDRWLQLISCRTKRVHGDSNELTGMDSDDFCWDTVSKYKVLFCGWNSLKTILQQLCVAPQVVSCFKVQGNAIALVRFRDETCCPFAFRMLYKLSRIEGNYEVVAVVSQTDISTD